MIEKSNPAAPFPGVIPPPQGVNPNIHFEPSSWNVLTQVACIASTTVFIFMRMYTKYICSLGYHTDDWVSLSAWASCTLYCSLCLAAGPLGLGTHMWNVTAAKFTKFFEVGYIIEVFYGPVIFLTKLAILLLLKRIFRIKRHFVLSVQALVYLLGLYYIIITLVKIFICWPVEKFWRPQTPGKCLNTNVIFISDCVISLITDFIILVSPLPVIWNLQLEFKRKIGTSFALVVGAIACVASVLRLEASIRTMEDHDKSYVFEPIVLYSSGEIAIGVICGCIPVLPALYRHARNKIQSHYSYGNSQSCNTGNEPLSRRNWKGMVPLQDNTSCGGPLSQNSEQRDLNVHQTIQHDDDTTALAPAYFPR